jgi:hypothetical protein
MVYYTAIPDSTKNEHLSPPSCTFSLSYPSPFSTYLPIWILGLFCNFVKACGKCICWQTGGMQKCYHHHHHHKRDLTISQSWTSSCLQIISLYKNLKLLFHLFILLVLQDRTKWSKASHILYFEIFIYSHLLRLFGQRCGSQQGLLCRTIQAQRKYRYTAIPSGIQTYDPPVLERNVP